MTKQLICTVKSIKNGNGSNGDGDGSNVDGDVECSNVDGYVECSNVDGDVFFVFLAFDFCRFCVVIRFFPSPP